MKYMTIYDPDPPLSDLIEQFPDDATKYDNDETWLRSCHSHAAFEAVSSAVEGRFQADFVYFRGEDPFIVPTDEFLDNPLQLRGEGKQVWELGDTIAVTFGGHQYVLEEYLY